MKLIKKKNIIFLLSGGGSNLYQILKKNLTSKKFNVISIISNNLISKQIKELIKSNLKTEIEIQNNYQINTSNLNYFRTKKILSSKNKTTLTDNFGNKLETNDFIYYVDQKKLKTKKRKKNNLI